jgi:hypothetical protein
MSNRRRILIAADVAFWMVAPSVAWMVRWATAPDLDWSEFGAVTDYSATAMLFLTSHFIPALCIGLLIHVAGLLIYGLYLLIKMGKYREILIVADVAFWMVAPWVAWMNHSGNPSFFTRYLIPFLFTGLLVHCLYLLVAYCFRTVGQS